VGEWVAAAGKFIPYEGFGINGDQYLQNLPGLTQIWGANLANLVGHIACIATHFDQVKGDDLHGKYRGLFAAKFLSATNSSVTIEALDSDDVCNLSLYNGINGTETEQEVCKVIDAVVFAPAPCDAAEESVDAFIPERDGEIELIGSVYKDTVEVELDATTGQTFCPGGYTFRKFIPKNRGGTGIYADWAFIGTVVSDNPDLVEQVICGDGVPGGVDGVEYSRYGCVPLEDELDPAVIPDCCKCSEWVQEP
jgi:hypothetical protein